MHELNERGALPPELHEWLRQLAETHRTQLDFMLAQRRGDKDLYELAAAVLIQRDGRFITLRTLVDECGSRNWNRLIYEAWAWETSQRIRALESRLDPLEVRALKCYAREFYEIDSGQMLEALAEARCALEGPPCPSIV